MKDIIKELKDNDIIITNNSYKKDLLYRLNNEKDFLNVKFLSKKELLSKYYFSCDLKAVYYLMNKYNINQDIANMYLDSIIYVEDKSYNNEKLDYLVKIKKDLFDNNLLTFDDLFKESLNKHRIVFYNYNYFSKLEFHMIEELRKHTDVLVIEKEYKEYTPKVYEFNTIFEEVEFIAISILKLIEKGISMSDIKLANVSSEYTNILDYIFPLYKLRTNINENYLISNVIAQEFLKKSGSLEDRIEYIKTKYNSPVIDQIISICNKYVLFDNIDIVIKMIANDFKSIPLMNNKYDNEIEIIDYQNYNTENKYIFLLGCNTSIPMTYKDEEYISDDIKGNLLIDSTSVKNKKEKDSTINNILNIENLVITYALSSPFATFYPSTIISDLNLEVIKNFKYDEIYSIDYSNIILGEEFDNYATYNTKSDILKNYNSSFSTTYNTYDNGFTGIDNKKILDKFKDGVNLSYSSMDNYYKCSFKYYINNVLKLNIYEDTFDAYIGSMFHYVLENGLLNDDSVYSLVDKFISENNRELSKKEKILVDNLIPDIKFALNTIKDNMKYTKLNNYLFEENIEVIKNDKVTVTFTGFIDKIMYKKDNDKTIVVLVDYKTGNTNISLDYLDYGLSMQLPIYLYLSKHSKKLDNIVFGGFYLQKVLPKKYTIDTKKTNDEKKKESLRLIGYSNSDMGILKEVDNCYDDSKMISGLKLTKNNTFYHYSKVLSNEQMNKVIDIVDNKIDNAIDNILNGNFAINPKVTDKNNLGCEYCNFKDICYKTKNDEVRIAPDKELSFLGGEQND